MKYKMRGAHWCAFWRREILWKLRHTIFILFSKNVFEVFFLIILEFFYQLNVETF